MQEAMARTAVNKPVQLGIIGRFGKFLTNAVDSVYGDAARHTITGVNYAEKAKSGLDNIVNDVRSLSLKVADALALPALVSNTDSPLRRIHDKAVGISTGAEKYLGETGPGISQRLRSTRDVLDKFGVQGFVAENYDDISRLKEAPDRTKSKGKKKKKKKSKHVRGKRQANVRK